MVWLFGSLLAAGLLWLSYIDLREFRLPDVLTFPLLAIGLLWSYLSGALPAALIGAVLGYSVFVALAYGFKKLRGIDGLGRGDAKLLAAGGAWTGWEGLPLIVLIASVLGIIIALLGNSGLKLREDVPEGWIPFGPCLAVGIFSVWAAGQLI